LFISEKMVKGLEIYLSNHGQGRVADLENMLVETSQPILRRHRIRIQERVRQSISSAKNDLVKILNCASVFKFNGPSIFCGDSPNWGFGNDAVKPESSIEELISSPL
jgi:hypothetical protein